MTRRVLLAVLALGLTGSAPRKTVEGSTERAVQWLKRQQAKDGGWSSGSGSEVATTSMAVMALVRHDAAAHRAEIDRGVEFVLQAIEQAPEDSPLLDTPPNTQIHRKLGPLVDTNLATVLLSTVLPLQEGADRARTVGALSVAVDKLEGAQAPDGSFEASGWAPVLSSALATQGLNRAAGIAEVDVDYDVLAKADAHQLEFVDLDNATLRKSRRGAGVNLYVVAATLRTNDAILARTGPQAPTPDVQRAATMARAIALEQVVDDGTGTMRNGFGSIGGEEVLSYMMIGDTLAGLGGQPLDTWHGVMKNVLPEAQNSNGSWSGHHCITSPVFTTAAAVLSLAPKPQS